jgi:uncharacterized protein YqhQ
MTENFHYGGQGVIEGVMMRGRKTMVTVVRRPDGELATDTQTLGGFYTGWMRKTPLLRGIVVMIEAMVLGMKTLFYSANVSMGEEEETLSGGAIWILVITSLVLTVALFFIAPLFLTKLINVQSSLVFSLIDGLIRLTIFIAYLKLLTLMPDIKRVFGYHGAEHKAVNAYEDGAPLELEAARKYGTAHARCGTSFLFTVMVIAIVVFALIGIRTLWLMVLSRVILIPVIAALSYEVSYFGSRHIKNRLVRAILTPGLWLQRMTTREPDDSQLEVALSALRRVIDIENEEEAEASQAPS